MCASISDGDDRCFDFGGIAVVYVFRVVVESCVADLSYTEEMRGDFDPPKVSADTDGACDVTLSRCRTDEQRGRSHQNCGTLTKGNQLHRDEASKLQGKLLRLTLESL